jgi:hypothetical protein
MARVQVFVDDAVRGRLPDVCVKDGTPANGNMLELRRAVAGSNGLGAAWVLLFFGPPGWLILLLIALFSDKREYLTVNLPYSVAARERFRATKRRRNAGGLGAGLVGAAVLVLSLAAGLGPAGVVIALGAFAVAVGSLVVGEVRMDRALVDLRLDASRRWVTITGVHPAFVAAVQAQDDQRAQSLGT